MLRHREFFDSLNILFVCLGYSASVAAGAPEQVDSRRCNTASGITSVSVFLCAQRMAPAPMPQERSPAGPLRDPRIQESLLCSAPNAQIKTFTFVELRC